MDIKKKKKRGQKYESQLTWAKNKEIWNWKYRSQDTDAY